MLIAKILNAMIGFVINIKTVKMSLVYKMFFISYRTKRFNLDLFYNLNDQIMIFLLENQSEIDYKSMLLTYSN